MSDYKKMTDKQINEKLQSFPNSMCLLDKKGNRKLIDYVADDAFCLRLIKEHMMVVTPALLGNENSDDSYQGWTVMVFGQPDEISHPNLNRAVLEACLQIKGARE